MIELPKREARVELEQMLGFDLRRRLSLLALSPVRSGILVGSDIDI